MNYETLTAKLLDLAEGRETPKSWWGWWNDHESEIEILLNRGEFLKLKPHRHGFSWVPVLGSQKGAVSILERKGVTVVPDIIANSGGVIVSYFEWVQNIQSVSWSEDYIDNQLKEILGRAFSAVCSISREKSVPLRTAAYLIAVKRVIEAKKLRGIWP